MKEWKYCSKCSGKIPSKLEKIFGAPVRPFLGPVKYCFCTDNNLNKEEGGKMDELKYFFCIRCKRSATSKPCKCEYEFQEVKIASPKEYCAIFGCLTYLGPVKLPTCPTCGRNLSGRNTSDK